MPSAPVVAIGDPDTVDVFAAFGIRVVRVEADDDAPARMREVARDPDVKIVFLTEPVYARARDVVEAYRSVPTPVITLIPTVSGNRHIAAEQLRHAVRIAIGSEIV